MSVRRFIQNDGPASFISRWPFKTALMIVAHPDDEILWAGGAMLSHPETRWTVVSLSRGNDPDRAPRFRRVLEMLGAAGAMGDLDDGPDQIPLRAEEARGAVLALMDGGDPDLILTHSVGGEYTRHRRHEEVGEAVLSLWDGGQIRGGELWAFAYRDARAIQKADIFIELPRSIWERKRRMVSEVYGFAPNSFEMNAARREEAFWRLRPIKEINR